MRRPLPRSRLRRRRCHPHRRQLRSHLHTRPRRRERCRCNRNRLQGCHCIRTRKWLLGRRIRHRRRVGLRKDLRRRRCHRNQRLPHNLHHTQTGHQVGCRRSHNPLREWGHNRIGRWLPGRCKPRKRQTRPRSRLHRHRCHRHRRPWCSCHHIHRQHQCCRCMNRRRNRHWHRSCTRQSRCIRKRCSPQRCLPR